MFPCSEFWSGGFWLFPVLILGVVLIIFLLVLFGNWQNANRVFCVPFKRDESPKVGDDESALDIAMRRFAEGKISKEEFEEIRTTIERY